VHRIPLASCAPITGESSAERLHSERVVEAPIGAQDTNQSSEDCIQDSHK
jgi:hypothetical protein